LTIDPAHERAAGAAVRPPPRRLLYLHGFRSSPQSFKAQRLAAWLAAHRPDIEWACPQLPPSPAEAMALCEGIVSTGPAGDWAVLGSSLGGFYATVLHNRHRVPTVVINPAVDPARDLAAHIGEQHTWQNPDDRFFFRAEYVDELRALARPGLAAPDQVLAIIATGDEVLDWREMAARYGGATQHIVPGSDHGLTDFDAHLPVALRFLRLASAHAGPWLETSRMPACFEDPGMDRRT
jgi:hypothetical protein